MRTSKKRLKAVRKELGDLEAALDSLTYKIPADWEAHDCVRNAVMEIQDARSLLRDKIEPNWHVATAAPEHSSAKP